MWRNYHRSWHGSGKLISCSSERREKTCIARRMCGWQPTTWHKFPLGSLGLWNLVNECKPPLLEDFTRRLMPLQNSLLLSSKLIIWSKSSQIRHRLYRLGGPFDTRVHHNHIVTRQNDGWIQHVSSTWNVRLVMRYATGMYRHEQLVMRYGKGVRACSRQDQLLASISRPIPTRSTVTNGAPDVKRTFVP